jgi:cobalamin synthase
LPGIVAWIILQPIQCAAAITVLLLFAIVFVTYVRRRLGGVTGDCLGCACYAAQVLVLFVAVTR